MNETQQDIINIIKAVSLLLSSYNSTLSAESINNIGFLFLELTDKINDG